MQGTLSYGATYILPAAEAPAAHEPTPAAVSVQSLGPGGQQAQPDAAAMQLQACWRSSKAKSRADSISRVSVKQDHDTGKQCQKLEWRSILARSQNVQDYFGHTGKHTNNY